MKEPSSVEGFREKERERAGGSLPYLDVRANEIEGGVWKMSMGMYMWGRM